MCEVPSNVCAVNKKNKINYERIKKICQESDFVKVNLMNQQTGGYISNVILTPALKDWLGMSDIFDEEVYLACFVPYSYGYLSGGFAVTKLGIFSNYIDSNIPDGIYLSFEDLAEAQKIYEACYPPTCNLKYLGLREPYRAVYHWLMADDKQLAFFVYTTCYGNAHIIDLFSKIASSVRRDLGIGRFNISSNLEI